MHYIFNGNAKIGQQVAQLWYPSGSIADPYGESANTRWHSLIPQPQRIAGHTNNNSSNENTLPLQSTLSSHASFQASTEYGSVDVSAANQQDNSIEANAKGMTTTANQRNTPDKEKNNCYLFPLNSSKWPARIAANPEAPAPSTTHFSSSTNRKMAKAIHSSFTTIILSSNGTVVANAL